MTAEQWARELQKAMARLAKTSPERQIARRNARADLARTLRGIRAAVDREYPMARNPRKKRRKPTLRQLVNAGWIHANGSEELTQCLAAKIPIKPSPVSKTIAMIPSWASILIRNNATIATLKRCKKDPEERKATIAAIDLAKERF